MALTAKAARRVLTVCLLTVMIGSFAPPPARAVSLTYAGYLADVRPVLHQWWFGLEAWRGGHFLLEPVDTNTANATQLTALLRQWWFALENFAGGHFLIEPVLTGIDTASELYQLLNQWQGGLEGRRGLHFLLEPPVPFVLGTVVTKTGTFDLSPKRATVEAAELLTYTFVWTVPKRRVWRDLDTVDLRICGDEAVPALWVRWDELTNSFRVFDAALGTFGPPAAPGSAVELETDAATLFLAGSQAEGGGLTGTSVTLTLAVAFKATMAGQACEVDAGATDDLGHDEGFKKAGKVRVKK
jgi:hypothetical protein